MFANQQQDGYKTMHLALYSLLIRLIAFLFWFGKSQILLDFRSFIRTFAFTYDHMWLLQGEGVMY